MAFKFEFRRSPVFAAALVLLAAITFTASPARADRCDDLAGQLKGQIDGLSVGKTAANVIYLSHPQAKQMTPGCPGRLGSRARRDLRPVRAPRPTGPPAPSREQKPARESPVNLMGWARGSKATNKYMAAHSEHDVMPCGCRHNPTALTFTLHRDCGLQVRGGGVVHEVAKVPVVRSVRVWLVADV